MKLPPKLNWLTRAKSADQNTDYVEGGRRKGENENPYLSARRTWNHLMDSSRVSRQNWMLTTLFSLLVALAAVGGMIHIGSQSKFIPYVVQVDSLGQVAAAAPADRAIPADPRILRATAAAFISDLRLVTPDIALQRKAVFRSYAHLSAKDPATAKANEWLNGSEESSPFKRAEKEMVSTELHSVLQQTADTWQIDWTETVRNRQGVGVGKPYRMRALVTLYTVPPTKDTKEEQLLDNPLGIFVRDFSWSKQL
jgi:type IV secretion system protein VirB5